MKWLAGRCLVLLVVMAPVVHGGSLAPLDPDPATLARGEYLWHPEIAPVGPVVVVVSLDEQRAYVYRNGIAIGLSTISSGRKGHETPPGVFTILQKDVIHFSNKYDNAPMPFMERLTWDGVAMHGGSLPGYPASHGCIRLPQSFAQKLFDITTRGVTVVVANRKTAPSSVVHPAMLAPVTTSGEPASMLQEPAYTWNDQLAPEGPVSILVSTENHGIFVFRNGILIAQTTFSMTEPLPLGGSVLYVMGEGIEYTPSPLDPSRPRHHWTAYPIATRNKPSPRLEVAASIDVPEEFARRVYDILVPGTTLLLTDLPPVRPAIDNAPTRVLESTARNQASGK